MLAAELPIVRKHGGVVYRYATPDAAATHLHAEAECLDLPRACWYCGSKELCYPDCRVAPWNLDEK